MGGDRSGRMEGGRVGGLENPGRGQEVAGVGEHGQTSVKKRNDKSRTVTSRS